MNLHAAPSLIVLCYLITTTRGNVLIDGKSSNCDCDYLVDELRKDLQMQQEQIVKLAEVQQEQHKLILLLLNKEGRKYEQDRHQISKREVPSAEDSNDYHDQLLSQLGFNAPGRDGKDGKDGKDGVNGENGRDGRDGIVAAPGRDGKDGKHGEDGIDGEDGENGENGRDGHAGDPGATGLPGVSGLKGQAGDIGATGLPGVSGPKGEAGDTGDTGATGVTGPSGPPGPPGPTDINAIEVLRGGEVFTRWGRTTCGLHSTLIYEGFAGNTPYNKPGGASNYQCLPLDPEYHDYSGSITFTGAYMAGVEYESQTYGLFPNSAMEQNVPCARCYTENRTAVMMIPAKRTCPDDWTKEYEGYLMTEHESHTRPSTFECVDADPEYIAGHGAKTNGGLLYFVKSYCSGTNTIGHCPPYYADRELTCVVCTK